MGRNILDTSPMQNGKGSKSRITNKNLFDANFMQIDWHYGATKEETHCKHLNCSECHGTGTKENGLPCVHMISCRCKNCSPGTL